jgi:hypothetical protein
MPPVFAAVDAQSMDWVLSSLPGELQDLISEKDEITLLFLKDGRIES